MRQRARAPPQGSPWPAERREGGRKIVVAHRGFKFALRGVADRQSLRTRSRQRGSVPPRRHWSKPRAIKTGHIATRLTPPAHRGSANYPVGQAMRHMLLLRRPFTAGNVVVVSLYLKPWHPTAEMRVPRLRPQSILYISTKLDHREVRSFYRPQRRKRKERSPSPCLLPEEVGVRSSLCPGPAASSNHAGSASERHAPIISNGQMPSSRMPAVRPSPGLVSRETISMQKPPIGEPYAGKSPVRFGGQGG